MMSLVASTVSICVGGVVFMELTPHGGSEA